MLFPPAPPDVLFVFDGIGTRVGTGLPLGIKTTGGITLGAVSAMIGPFVIGLSVVARMAKWLPVIHRIPKQIGVAFMWLNMINTRSWSSAFPT